jgi:hypothetical protein
MSTYSSLIRDSLGLIGVLDETEEPSPEQGNLGLRVLGQMLTRWESKKGIDVGFASGAALNDTLNIEDDAVSAVTLSLAVELCPWFEREASPQVLILAGNAFNDLLRDAVRDQMQEASMSNLPRGTGQVCRDWTDES